jgi:polysaccharide pyruvyl transferase WcaK-like protein
MPSSKKKKILIMTATGKSNLGDELILREEIRFLRSRYGDVTITVCTYNPKTNLIADRTGIKFISYFPNHLLTRPFQNIWYFFTNIFTIYRSDIVIIGGGGIVFDNEPGVSFDNLVRQWYFRTKIARIAGSLLLFWGISLEVTMISSKLALKSLFVAWDFVLVRDTRSKELLEALEVPSIIIHDIVFLYENEGLKALPGLKKKRVGISVRGGFLEGTEEAIPQIYDYLIAEGYEPIFLVFSTEWSIEQNDSLYIKKLMSGRTYNVTKTIDQTLNVFPFLYASIAMRFHAWVLSCVHESPCIHVSYGPKTDELVNLLAAEHLTIKPNELSLAIFQKMWHNLTTRYDDESDRLKQRNSYIKKELRHSLETL